MDTQRLCLISDSMSSALIACKSEQLISAAKEKLS